VDRTVLPLGAPHAERADAVRNRRHLLATAREMLAGEGADTLTMDALAQRAGLGKGTVFRRFGTRAGIFQALLDDDERAFQSRSCPGHRRWARARRPLDRLDRLRPRPDRLPSSSTGDRPGRPDGSQPIRPGRRRPCPRPTSGSCSADPRPRRPRRPGHPAHRRSDGPLLLYLSASDLAGAAVQTGAAPQTGERIARGWQDLVQRVCRT
jgi:polyketide synthase 12